MDALSDILERFSKLMADFPQISSADLNAVRVFTENRGALVLDLKLFKNNISVSKNMCFSDQRKAISL
ncbi:MAG: hypothetical protein DRG25_03635 [Deltaproteobacteria bacterium]|nr:MAG: hypothetical protein DRG25_03635 [Deltaproteobacteria bacterium]